MLRSVLIATFAITITSLSCAQAATAPKVVTLRNSGATFTVEKGAELQLHLTERYRWNAPRIRGTAVRLVPIEFFRDPGYLAWSVKARARGKAVVTAVGYGESMHLFRVTFLVR